MIREVLKMGDPRLLMTAEPVSEFATPQLTSLLADMHDTMEHLSGAGLAAPQIGLSLRLFVMDCEGIKLVAANPEIIKKEGEQSGPEACLSVGKVPAVVVRAERATLRAQDLKGEWFERDASGYASRCFQHETDHCDGKLFIDHLPKMRREMVVKRFRKEKKWNES